MELSRKSQYPTTSGRKTCSPKPKLRSTTSGRASTPKLTSSGQIPQWICKLFGGSTSFNHWNSLHQNSTSIRFSQMPCFLAGRPCNTCSDLLDVSHATFPHFTAVSSAPEIEYCTNNFHFQSFSPFLQLRFSSSFLVKMDCSWGSLVIYSSVEPWPASDFSIVLLPFLGRLED
jgi:hypothetical protein